MYCYRLYYLLVVTAINAPVDAARFTTSKGKLHQLPASAAPDALANGELRLPFSLFDDNSSAIAARAEEARALAELLHAPVASGLAVHNASGVGSLAHGSTELAGGAGLGTNASAELNIPRVFFLFMTYAGLNDMELWAAFFLTAQVQKWKGFVHCVQPLKCRKSMAALNPFGLQQVETVPSTYCHDLVSPMVQLLRVASKESTHANDKFVFLSESTLPVKPFNHIYNVLSKNADSDFCFEPRDKWLWLKSKQQPDIGSTMVKHSQWVVLSSAHAKQLVGRWAHVAASEASSWSVPVWPASQKQGYTETDFGRIPRFKACTDEWAIFGSLYGVVMSNTKVAKIPGISSPNLNIAGQWSYKGQGVCRTFVTWGHFAGRESSDLAQKIPYLLSCYPHCEGFHPAHFHSMTDYGLKVLRNSDFFFARKFPPDVVSLEPFQRVILQEGR